MSDTTKKYYYHYATALGDITIVCNQNAVTAIAFDRQEINDAKNINTNLLDKTFHEIEEYLSGTRMQFDIPIELKGTDFQKKVWNALLSIPYGETRSYLQVAEIIDNPKACRAVGMANHKNPIPIIIPCHRVIGKNGSLVGYGGGLEIKEKLLEIERK